MNDFDIDFHSAVVVPVVTRGRARASYFLMHFVTSDFSIGAHTLHFFLIESFRVMQHVALKFHSIAINK